MSSNSIWFCPRGVTCSWYDVVGAWLPLLIWRGVNQANVLLLKLTLSVFSGDCVVHCYEIGSFAMWIPALGNRMLTINGTTLQFQYKFGGTDPIFLDHVHFPLWNNVLKIGMMNTRAVDLRSIGYPSSLVRPISFQGGGSRSDDNSGLQRCPFFWSTKLSTPISGHEMGFLRTHSNSPTRGALSLPPRYIVVTCDSGIKQFGRTVI